MKRQLKRMISLIVAIVMLMSLAGISVSADVQVSTKSRTTIEAIKYDVLNGTTSKIEGGSLSFQKNAYAEFYVTASEEMEVDVYLLTGAPHDRTLTVTVNGTKLSTVKGAATKSYQTFSEDIASRAKLLAGQNVIRVTNTGSACYFNAVILAPVTEEENALDKTGPFRTYKLPTLIEAEDYNYGADGFYSVDGANNGKPYRKEAVNVLQKEDKTGYLISLEDTEWTKYTFEVTVEGPYTMYVNGTASFLDVYIDNFKTPVITGKLVDGNGETDVVSVYLTEGTHTVMLKSSGVVADIDYFRFATCFDDYIMIEDVVEDTKHSIYKEFYVSADGDDKNDGSKDAPFKTIDGAKAAIKKISDEMTGDIIVNIASGYYQLDKTLEFNETDSGKNGYNIIYKGEDENNPPLISGGQKITGWTKASNGLFWKAPVETDTFVRNLYVNGYPAIRARSKYSYVHAGDYDKPNDKYGVNGFKVSAVNFPTNIIGEQDLETVWPSEWTAQRALVLDTHTDGEYVYFEMEPVFWENRNTSTYLDTGYTFWIENSFALLDEPGEFYYNKEEKYIYYYPYEQEDMQTADVFIGELEGLVNINGKDLDHRVENITFENLEFRYSVWDDASIYGLRTRQSDYLSMKFSDIPTTVTPTHIELNRTKNVDFVNSRFACLGAAGIGLLEAVEDTDITGNIFRDISATAILISKQEHYTADQYPNMVKNITIKNNVFTRNACEYLASHNIFLLYARNVLIDHNTFLNSPYSSVSAGWGWGSSNSKVCGEYIITHNQFFDSMLRLADGGPIYTLGDNQNSLIAYNHFDGIGIGGNGYGAVYNDQGSQHFTYTKNVVSDHSAMWFVNINSKNLHAKDNYIAEGINEKNAEKSGQSNITLEGTVVVKDGNWPAEAQQIMADAGIEDEYSRLLAKADLPSWREPYYENLPEIYKTGEGLWIEAEDYIPGAEGETWYNGTWHAINKSKRVTRDGYFVDKNGPGLWMLYEFEVPEDGYYDIWTKASHSMDSLPGFKFSIDGEVVIDEFLIKKTSWNLYDAKRCGAVYIEKGKHILKAELLHNGCYICAFAVVPEGTNMGTEQNPNFDDGILNGATIKQGFTDIKGHWAEEAINAMTQKGLINGFDEATFGPDRNLTLHQALWLSMRVMELEYNEENGIEDAVKYGVIDTDESDREVTREEFISILIKAYGIKNNANISTTQVNKFFDDSEISAELKETIYKARKLGFINGDENGNFNPKKSLSRAEAVTVFNNILSKDAQ